MFPHRVKFRKTGFFFIFFLLSPLFYGQSVSLVNYTLDDGLPSNQVHCSFQQDNGTMLFGTDVGLISYNGIFFKTLPFTQFQKSNATIFKIVKGANGRIYINTYRNGLFVLEGDSVHPYIFNHKLLELCGQSFISNFIISKNNDLHFSLYTKIDYRVYKIDSKGRQSLTQPDSIYTLHSHNPRKFLFFLEDSISISKSTGIQGYGAHIPRRYPQIFDPQHLNNINLKVDNSKFKFLNLPKVEFSFDYKLGQPENSVFHKGKWWVSYNSKLAVFDNEFNLISIHEFGFKIQHILPFDKSSVIVSHNSGAARLMLTNHSFAVEPIIFGELISSSYKDKDGGVWLTSTKNGIYYTPSLKIKTFDNPIFSQTDILKIETNPTEIIIANRKGDIGFYSIPEFQLRYTWDTLIPSMRFILEPGYFQSIRMQMDFDSANISIKKIKMLSFNDFYQFPNSDSILLATPRQGIHLAKKRVDWTYDDLKRFDRDLKTYSVHVLDKTVYLGTDNGIQIFSLAQIEYNPYLPNLIKTRILDLESIEHKLIASTNEGIYICENESVVHLTVKDGLASNNCRKLEVQNDSTFWVANKLGLNKIIFNQKTGKYQILTFTRDDGLISNSINDLSIEGENLFIATSKGLCYTEIESLIINKSSIPFVVDFPVLQRAGFNFFDTLVLPKEKRDIYLFINEKSFRHNENLNYSFALNGGVEVISSTNSISFGNLQPGYNSVALNVASANGIWNSKPTILSVWASPFYYEQLWFKALISILIIVSLYFAYKQREKRRNQQLKMAIANQEATVSKYNALSLQLSPHFIFNSLNNIQYLSVSKNYVAVNQFVANLARLTRKILEHSTLQLVPLETEIENLKLYLEIEQIRFEHKPIEIKFEIDSNLDLEGLLIPPMIIQPSVENAIWHGLLNKVGSRKLDIIIHSLENGFEVQIRDNGIGLNTKQKDGLRIKGQTSIGVKNTKDRIQLYNEMDMGVAEFSLEELNDNDKVLGTLASFSFIPKNKNDV